MSRLRCERCGLAYSRAAIAREMALATGVACEVRCATCPGGQLAAAPLEAARERAPVAVPA